LVRIGRGLKMGDAHPVRNLKESGKKARKGREG
jgi:hypothetical protein